MSLDKKEKSNRLEILEEAFNSENIFILAEGELNKTDIAFLEKKSNKLIEISSGAGGLGAFNNTLAKNASNFNIFSLTDALCEKNKLKIL